MTFDVYGSLLSRRLIKLIKEEYPNREDYFVYVYKWSVLNGDTLDIKLSYGADNREIRKINIMLNLKYKWAFKFIKGMVLGTILADEDNDMKGKI